MQGTLAVSSGVNLFFIKRNSLPATGK